MILFGRYQWIKAMCHPWLVPQLLRGLYIYYLFLVFTLTSNPDVPDVTLKGVRTFGTIRFFL
ncbi:MAG: hypothetical protein CMI18_09885 [Opitutaceae bacterium]|nr:hypothetical protein [Opitutaceae bacterium]